MNIVIAGCGWLGMKLAGILQANGHSVTGTRRTIAGSDPGISFIAYDPEVPVDETTKETFTRADVVVLSFPPDRSSKEKYAADCMRTAKLCSDRARILMVSSTSVYPDIPARLTETDTDNFPPNPILIAEKSLSGFAKDRLMIIRMAGLFGKDRVIVNHLSKSGKTYNGNEPVNLVHQEDAAGICAFAIEQNITGQIWNACSGNHPEKDAYYTWLAGKLAILPPKFRESAPGKTISSERSRIAGYHYKMDDPYDFLK